MARLVVLCVVIALSCGQIKMHPLEPNARDINNNAINIDGLETRGDTGENIFKLPTAITDRMTIKIKGTMNIEETFIAVIKSMNGDEESLCTIAYDFNKETIRVDYPKCKSPPCYDIQTEYTLSTDTNKETTFALTLTARIGNNKEGILDIVFEGNEHDSNGPSKVFTCQIKNLNNIGYIQMKQGVEQVASILFQFSNQNMTIL